MNLPTKLRESDVAVLSAYRIGAGWRVEAAGIVLANGATLPDALRAAAARIAGAPADPAPASTSTGGLLSSREVAARLGISVRGVQDLINAGHIRALRIGKLHRIEEHEVERFIARLRAGEITWKGGR